MSTSFDSNPYLTWLIQHEQVDLLFITHFTLYSSRPFFLRLSISNVFLAIPETQIFKIFRGRMPPDPPRKLTPSALGIVPTPRSLWVMNNKCRGWMKILSNKLTLNFTHLQFGIGLHRGAQIIHRSRAQKSPWKCSNCRLYFWRARLWNWH